MPFYTFDIYMVPVLAWDITFQVVHKYVTLVRCNPYVIVML